MVESLKQRKQSKDKIVADEPKEQSNSDSIDEDAMMTREV